MPAALEGISNEQKVALAQRNLNHIAYKEKPIDKDEAKWSILRGEQPPAYPVKVGHDVASPKKPTMADLKTFSIDPNYTRGKGSMDHKQRTQAMAKEFTYIDKLEVELNKDKPTERANSIAKDFHETRTRNDSLIKDQLKLQNEKLLEKLKERQVNSFNKSIQKMGDSSMRKTSNIKDAKDLGKPC